MTVVMCAVLSAIRARSAFSRLRNEGRGRSRSASAICSIVITRSGIAASHPRAQRFERAELELLDGALGFLQALRDFANAPFVHEPVEDDRALIRRKRVDEPEQTRHLVDVIEVELGCRRWRIGRRGGLACR